MNDAELFTTKINPVVGMHVHVYYPAAWDGPQPGVIVWPGKPEGGPLNRYDLSPDGSPTTHQGAAKLVNVNVFVDGVRFPRALQAPGFTSEDGGGTLKDVPLFGELTPEQRIGLQKALDNPHEPWSQIWAEMLPIKATIEALGLDKPGSSALRVSVENAETEKQA